jgi:AraC family transcriptional activator of mtrCDE
MLITGAAPVSFKPHTLVIVPAGRVGRILVSDSIAPAGRGSSNSVISDPSSQADGKVSIGTGAPRLRLIGGRFFATYGPNLDLFASLASPIVEGFDPHDQLDQVMSYLIAELATREVGGSAMSRALLKLVLLALLRRCLVSQNAWVERFSMLSDPPIARAFAAMAASPAATHTVQSLCQLVGLGRSAFMKRFAAKMGEAPMAVLRRLRLRHAASLLAANALSIDQVALQSGYQSRSSFTRTFRKYYGRDPSEYRADAQRDAFGQSGGISNGDSVSLSAVG